MTIRSVSRSRVLTWGALVAFALFVVPLSEMAWAQAQSGSLVGFVYAKDMKTPVAGAVVKVRNIANQKEYASEPTDANGMYKIAAVDEGRYILGISAATGDFNFEYGVQLKSGEIAKLSVGLAPGMPAAQGGSGKKNFFNSTLGFAVMVAAAGVAFFVIFAEGTEASPKK